jgi:hypothetical protein
MNRRLNKFYDVWDDATAPGRESYFMWQLAIFAAVTIFLLAIAAWWYALMSGMLVAVLLRMLWEDPQSRVRRVISALLHRTRN